MVGRHPAPLQNNVADTQIASADPLPHPPALTFSSPGGSVDPVPEDQSTRGIIRYETVIATLVGVLALAVSGYTAYMQRQQVRAAVWPILEYQSSNLPDIHLTVANKGVGPAIVRNVIVRVDGKPVKNWAEALEKLVGPGHHFNESDINGHVFAAGESMIVFTPVDDNQKPFTFDNTDPLRVVLNKGRFRISLEICYGSTLGESWTLRSDANTSSTVETRTCPGTSAATFEQ